MATMTGERQLENTNSAKTGRYRLSIRTWMWAVLVFALALAIGLAPREKLGRLVFGGGYVSKTQFTAQDVEQLEALMGIRLPEGAKIELATFGGSRDHELTVRLHMPRAEAKAFEQAVRNRAAKPTMAFLGSLQSGANEWSSGPGSVESAVQVGQASQFIFCRPEREIVTVYFETFAWLDDEVDRVAKILFEI